MKIALVTPARPGTRSGNRHTALRWAAFLRAAGHRVAVSTEWRGEPADALLALHARRSHASIKEFPGPVVLALTGTDIYQDIHRSPEARRSIDLARELIVLQSKAAEEIPGRRVHVVVQSSSTRLRHAPVRGRFRICVIGHLRAVKDPLRTLLALPHVKSDIEVVQLGELLEPDCEPKSSDPRYRWLGSVPHGRALRWLASSHAMVISSRMEGGANVVCEALRIGVPVLASRISGNEGLLGARYPGYFRVGDERDLARLIDRAAGDAAFYRSLKKQVTRLRATVSPRNEARALRATLASLPPLPRGRRRRSARTA